MVSVVTQPVPILEKRVRYRNIKHAKVIRRTIMANELKAIEYTLKKEGWWSDDPNDSGGETTWGITKGLALKHSWWRSMKKMPQSKAIEIYLKEFAKPLKIGYFKDQAIANMVFRISVHTGRHFGAKSFQIILNTLNRLEADWPDIKEDGKIGRNTLACFNKALAKRYRRANIIKLLLIIYGYEKLFSLARKRKKDEIYINGWLNTNIVLGRID